MHQDEGQHLLRAWKSAAYYHAFSLILQAAMVVRESYLNGSFNHIPVVPQSIHLAHQLLCELVGHGIHEDPGVKLFRVPLVHRILGPEDLRASGVIPQGDL